MSFDGRTRLREGRVQRGEGPAVVLSGAAVGLLKRSEYGNDIH